MRIQKIYYLFDNKAASWLHDLEEVDGTKIQLRPAEKLWSFAEVYDHVMKVTRTYQIPNLKKSLTDTAVRKRRKSMQAMIVFHTTIRKNVHLKLEKFPQDLIEKFTPVKRTKEDLLIDFKKFIQEVNDLKEIVNKSTSQNKQYHPLFGDITTKEWFALVEQHMWQHDKQMRKLKEFLKEAR